MLWRDLSNSYGTQFVLGLGAGRLHQDMSLVAMVSQHIASCYHRPLVCLHSLQAPRIMKDPDSVTSEARLEPNTLMVSHSRSVSVLHMHQRCKRTFRCITKG